MTRALRNSSVIVCAWHADQLVGFARVITDYAWFAYLSQIAVKPEFQKRGIGKELIARAQKEVGEEAGLTHLRSLIWDFDSTKGRAPDSGLI
jgi:ribosomal protein S18 acetylase RimI-like enzyme